jgi:hypothetical protein
MLVPSLDMTLLIARSSPKSFGISMYWVRRRQIAGLIGGITACQDRSISQAAPLWQPVR